MKKLISLFLAIIMVFAVSVTAFATDKTHFVVLGDSIAYGCGLKDKDNYSYGALVCGANDYTYSNHAENGDTTYDLNDKLTHNPEIISDVDSADIISISIGGNNLRKGGIVSMAVTGIFGNYKRIDSVTADFYENFCLAIDTIRSINPDAELLVQTLYNPQTDLLQGIYQYAIDKLNSYIELAAAEKTFTVVQVDDAFAGKADEYIQDDIIHPNEKGHYVIATEYLKVLKDMGLGTAQKPVVDEADVIIYSLIDKILDFFRSLFIFRR